MAKPRERERMNDFRKAAQEIIDQIGGLDNIESVQHCMTRLRFVVKKNSEVNENNIKELDMVKGYINSGGQHQVIYGTGIVNKVYKEIDGIFKELGKSNEVRTEGGTFLQRMSRLFGDIFIPIIPVIVASGMLMGVRTYLMSSGILTSESPWINVAAILIDTSFSFLPALVGWSAAKKFGGNPVYGFLIGLMVISSSLPAGPAVGRGTAEPLMITILGLDFALKGFQGSVLIAVLGGYLVSVIEPFVRKFYPKCSRHDFYTNSNLNFNSIRYLIWFRSDSANA